MRRTTLFALSSVSFTALALAATPAVAQTEQAQEEAQEANVQVECSTIADPAQRQSCVDTQGANALPESGAPADDAIVVTGSRIKRPNFETLQPAIVIDSAQIEARGFETLGQAINEQPAFGVPGATPVGPGQAGSFGSGQSFVNFLGLGDQRTLTLVNGRRFVSSNTASIFGPSNLGVQVDLNSINTKLVSRVETIAIGGAPIYGSDAIAGTVNVILKRDYEGIDIDAQYGIASRGDAPNWRIRALAGHNFADGRGNITISGEYNQGKGLLFNDRAVTRANLFYGDCRAGSSFDQCLFPDRRIPSISESGIPTVGGELFGLNFPLSPEQMEFLIFGDPTLAFTVQDASGNQLQFTPNGQLIPIDFGQSIGDIPGALDFNIDFSGGNGYVLNNTQQLLSDSKRYNTNVIGQYEITDNIRLFGELWYAYSKGTQLRNQPVYNSGIFDVAGSPDGPIILSVDNPFLTPEQRALILDNIENNPLSERNIFCFLTGGNPGFCGANRPEQDFFYLSRANTDLYSANASTATYLWRGVAGLDGTFNLGSRQFNWEVVANYGHAKTKGYSLEVVQQNFDNAVGQITADNPNGVPCLAGLPSSPIETLNPTCTPLNLFGTGLNSADALNHVLAESNPTGINKQRVITASVNGPALSLPGGDLGLALGLEFRREATDFDPGDFFFGGPDPDPATDDNGDGDPTNDRVQFGRSVPILPVKGHYTTKEIFGEIRAPIASPANNIPGIHSLELHGAARYVDHSTAGKDWTYTAEGRWGIVRDIAVRGNFTHAIRAPAITEVFNPSSTFFGFAIDPCDADSLNSGPDPATRQANCLAAGLPPTFQSLSNQASFHQSIAGNVDLENEKSDAWSAGVILNPSFIPGLTISADYLDIKLKDAIAAFSASQVAAACFDDPNFPNNEFCPLIQRDPVDDQFSFIETRFFNAAQLRYKGVLGALDYRRRTPFLGSNSQVGVNLSYQYLDTLTTKATSDSAATTTHGTIGYPKHSAVLNVNYQNGPVGLFTAFNYTGRVIQEADQPDNFREHNRLDDVLFVNSGISFNIDNPNGIAKGMTFRVVVDNVFDTKPPFPVPAFGGSISYFPGILGRYFRFGAGVRF